MSQYILNVGDFSKTFQPLAYNPATTAWSLASAVTMPLELKAMHDEMGGVYDTMFGRMSGMLGITNPGFPGMIPFPYSSPPTDIVKGSLEATPIGMLADGTQLWRIFHNGVDTHPIHTHLFTAQLINRVGQDGQVASGTLPVDPTDLGWKDTFKINPLEVIFLALRPTVPTVSQVPFEVPNSVRLLDPTLPEGATLPPPGPAGWFDPATNTHPGDPEPLRQLRLGVRVALPHPVPRRDGPHALAGVRGSADGADRPQRYRKDRRLLRTELSWTDNSQTEIVLHN